MRISPVLALQFCEERKNNT